MLSNGYNIEILKLIRIVITMEDTASYWKRAEAIVRTSGVRMIESKSLINEYATKELLDYYHQSNETKLSIEKDLLQVLLERKKVLELLNLIYEKAEKAENPIIQQIIRQEEDGFKLKT